MRTMSGSMKDLGLDRLDVAKRLELLEEIWESLDQEARANLPVPPEQLAELEVRLADAKSHPDDTIPWEDIENSLPPPRGGK